jgi:hypothetical protein
MVESLRKLKIDYKLEQSSLNNKVNNIESKSTITESVVAVDNGTPQYVIEL